MTRSIIETRKTCPDCGRVVDAVRLPDVGGGLRFSRHFKNPNAEKLTFCRLSFEPIKGATTE